MNDKQKALFEAAIEIYKIKLVHSGRLSTYELAIQSVKEAKEILNFSLTYYDDSKEIYTITEDKTR